MVNSVLALKSYHEWKQTGGTGVWKFSGNVKPTMSVKQFVRTKSEPFTNSLTRNSSMTEKSLNALSHDIDTNKMVSAFKTVGFLPFFLFVSFLVNVALSIALK